MTAIRNVKQKGRCICPHQAAFLFDNWLRRWLQNPVKLVNHFVGEGDTVIDMGCGPGFFTIDMAKMVGATGRVIAVDLQPKMLNKVKRKAHRHGVADRITCHQCRPDRIGLECSADFILAFYMVHETPDQRRFFKEAKALVRGTGKLLVVEPRLHVRRSSFAVTLNHAGKAGWDIADWPFGKDRFSVLLTPLDR